MIAQIHTDGEVQDGMIGVFAVDGPQAGWRRVFSEKAVVPPGFADKGTPFRLTNRVERDLTDLYRFTGEVDAQGYLIVAFVKTGKHPG